MLVSWLCPVPYGSYLGCHWKDFTASPSIEKLEGLVDLRFSDLSMASSSANKSLTLFFSSSLVSFFSGFDNESGKEDELFIGIDCSSVGYQGSDRHGPLRHEVRSGSRIGMSQKGGSVEIILGVFWGIIGVFFWIYA